MSPTVIRIENISKRYVLGQRSGYSEGFRHALENALLAPFRLFRRKAERTSVPSGDFWALDDVSFEIKQGEIIGIIGRNGAGKSTLLKILSRITEPTTGRVSLKGRIASLLEVGTGFHPELTGRENIFLNGAILGMTRNEIRGKLDEIIAFAGIEKFLDSPVKRYSSGMYVRLAFAVAAHLDPEILIVDEVLAVGDAEFQQKCLGKMHEATATGRTILFVSHNLPAVASLCQHCAYLEAGRLKLFGDTATVLERYSEDTRSEEPVEQSLQRQHLREGSGTHRIVSVLPGAKEFPAREPLTFRIRLKQYLPEGPFNLSLHIVDRWLSEVIRLSTEFREGGGLTAGDQEVMVTIQFPWLPPGDYYADAHLYAGGVVDHWPDAVRFRISMDVARLGYTFSSSRDVRNSLAAFEIEVLRDR